MRYALPTLAVASFCLAAHGALAQSTPPGTSLTVTDSRGADIVFPLGLASFADAVISYAPGSDIPSEAARNPAQVLGFPDYAGGDQGTFVTLGCGGQAVWAFTDNALVDVDGPDLWIFEVGPDVEGMAVAVSADGTTWLDVGSVAGSTSTVDLAGYAPAGASYRFVRLTDDGVQCSGRTPGADVDAIGAIGAIERIALDLPPTSDTTAYDDTRGSQVQFPAGDISFADAVVSYTPGSTIEAPGVDDPSLGLHAPDYVGNGVPLAVTLGCGGQVVYQFIDNTLIDVPGADLFIFEVGPDVEGTILAISGDGVSWTDIGAIEGATAQIDIAPHIQPGETFQFVRLTDGGLQCSGRFPGADIDAVGAIGSATRLVLDANLLFDFDSATLRRAGLQAVSELAAAIRSGQVSQVIVDGHTDAAGSDAYNQTLSQERAVAVAQALMVQGVAQGLLTTRAFGESRPVADNGSEAGAQQNRRVEVLLIGG
ncbi:OmpA family protein [Jannaschia sp. CCS1]|uniref:OmpA family protein n=1 Tax=Jannaschia sp. (strain CCS1) TaxID=290400 RepID=UPI000053A28D|nr:OmpA family protein [Jannaschia sp. CCS1]ABD55703.1 OmpA/MotB [Jannaschia sp. CCS1]